MRKTLLLVFVLALTASVFPQKKMTLDEAVSIALQGNTTLIKSKNALMGNEKQVKSATGNLLPNLSVTGSWGWTKNQNDLTTPSTEYDSRSYSVSAGGSWTLFDGLSNFNYISQSKDQLKSAQFSLSKLKEDIVQETMSRFYDVLNAREQLKVRNDNVKFNEKLLETIKERNRLGSVAVADVYTQQVQFGQAELALITAENNFESAKLSLLNYLSVDDVLADYEFVDPRGDSKVVDTDYYMKEFSTVADMVSQALENRKDYKSLRLDVQSAEYGVSMAQSSYMPSLTGTYSVSAGAGAIGDMFDNKTYRAGLSLNIPIFSNYNTEYGVQIAKISLMNTLEDLASGERLIKLQIKQGYQDLAAAKKAFEVSRENIKAAEERRKITYERYNLGSGTILDVLQADRDYTQALSDDINVEFQFYRSVDQLKNYLGNLDIKKYE